MDIVLYDKPMHIELIGYNLFVNGNQHPKSVRTVSQMAKTLMRSIQLDELENFDMYYMYRNVYKEAGMRFDITVMPSKPVGDECSKTHGHYHPKSEDGLAYPELYQVLHGRAEFILQKKNKNGSVDAALVSAKEREVVLLPPGYGHVSVNSGDDVLVLSNLVYDRFDSLYQDYETNRGAAYYYLKEGEIVQNTSYIVERNERVTAKEFNIRYKFECKDILSEAHIEPGKFAFLQKPSLLFKA